MDNIINEIPNINSLLYADGVYSLKKIKKKNKTDRNIYVPNNKLKKIQKGIKGKLEEDYANEINRMKYQNAYLKEKSIIDNAKVHVDSKYLIKLDIKNFFDTITFPRIYGKFRKKYTDDVALKLAQLSCYRINGKHIALAQGSPCSPLISNLISQHVDIYFLKYIKKKFNNMGKINYSRYSDDITISTNSEEIYKLIKKDLQEEKYFIEFERFTSFELNKEKIGIFEKGRKIVTGIVINEKLNISKRYRNEIRNYLRNANWNLKKTIDNFEKKNEGIFLGPSGKELSDEEKVEKFENILRGKINFIKQVKNDDFTYNSLAVLFNKIKEFKVRIDVRNDFEKAIYSLQIKDDSHGTFFYITLNEKVYVLSCYHVFENIICDLKVNGICIRNLNIWRNNNMRDIVPIFQDTDEEYSEGRRITISNKFLDGISYSEELDYILISSSCFEEIFKFDNKYTLEFDLSSSVQDSNVFIKGYPEDYSVFTTHQQMVKNVVDKRIILQSPVGAGASGSPVLMNGKVVGMYDKGHCSESEGSCIPINLIIEKFNQTPQT